jgi:hypothetical protein
MKLKKETIKELKQILIEEFNYKLNGKELENFGNYLVGYVGLLMKLNKKL